MTPQKLLDDLNVTVRCEDGFHVFTCDGHGFILPPSYDGGLDVLYGSLILQSQDWKGGKSMVKVANMLTNPDTSRSDKVNNLLFDGIMQRYVSAHKIRDINVVGGVYQMRLVCADRDDVLSTNQFLRRNMAGRSYEGITLDLREEKLYLTTPSLDHLRYGGPSVDCLTRAAKMEADILKAVLHKIRCDVTILSDEYQKVVNDVIFGRAAFNAVERYIESHGLRVEPLPKGYESWISEIPVVDLKLTDVRLVDGQYRITNPTNASASVVFPNLTSMLVSMSQVLTPSNLKILMSAKTIRDAFGKPVAGDMP